MDFEIRELNKDLKLNTDEIKYFMYENYGNTSQHTSRIIFKAMKNKYGFSLLLIYFLSFLLIFFVSRIVFEFTNRGIKSKSLSSNLTIFISIILFCFTFIYLLKGYTKILEKKHGYRTIYEIEADLEEKYMRRENERLWVAIITDKKTKAEKLIGTVSIRNGNLRLYPKGVFEENTKIGHIQRLTVHKAFRNKGLGSALLANTVKWAKEKGYNYVSADIFQANDSALKVCKKIGLEKLSDNIIFPYLGLGNVIMFKKL